MQAGYGYRARVMFASMSMMFPIVYCAQPYHIPVLLSRTFPADIFRFFVALGKQNVPIWQKWMQEINRWDGDRRKEIMTDDRDRMEGERLDSTRAADPPVPCTTTSRSH